MFQMGGLAPSQETTQSSGPIKLLQCQLNFKDRDEWGKHDAQKQNIQSMEHHEHDEVTGICFGHLKIIPYSLIPPHLVKESPAMVFTMAQCGNAMYEVQM